MGVWVYICMYVWGVCVGECGVGVCGDVGVGVGRVDVNKTKT